MKIFYSVCHVCLMLTVLMLLINSGLFDMVETECGFSFYAENLTNWESAMSQILPPEAPTDISLPEWFQMPANTVVNIGYVVVGFLILKKWSSLNAKEITDQQYYAFVFAWLSIFYGPIQFTRIVTQSHRWAVLDQWITLVIISWVVIWYLKAYQPHLITNKYSYTAMYVISFVSYILTLFTKIGFEIALGIHLLIAMVAAVHLVMNYDNAYTRYSFVCLILSCCGFVFLKLYDFELANLQSVFSVLTGHFWSKVCDCLQIHYAAMILLQAHSVKTKAQ